MAGVCTGGPARGKGCGMVFPAMQARLTRCGALGPSPIACSIDQVVYIPLSRYANPPYLITKGLRDGVYRSISDSKGLTRKRTNSRELRKNRGQGSGVRDQRPENTDRAVVSGPPCRLASFDTHGMSMRRKGEILGKVGGRFLRAFSEVYEENAREDS